MGEQRSLCATRHRLTQGSRAARRKTNWNLFRTLPARVRTRGCLSHSTVALLHFALGTTQPALVISPGSAGHAYVFAELGYRIQQHAPSYLDFKQLVDSALESHAREVTAPQP